MVFFSALLAGALYTVFFIPVGDRTLYQHGHAIAETEPAQNLVVEMSEMGLDLLEDVRDAAASSTEPSVSQSELEDSSPTPSTRAPSTN